MSKLRTAFIRRSRVTKINGTQKLNLTIHIDGGARGNPGLSGIGVVLRNQETGQLVHEGGYFIGQATNNVAEYSALIRSLELAKQYHARHLLIHSDSELMVSQMTGKYKVKSEALIKLHRQAMLWVEQFESWEIKHVYRKQNSRADELANMAMDAQSEVIAGQPTSSPTAAREKAASVDSHSSPVWTATVTSPPSNHFAGGCELGQSFTFGPTTPQGMCVFAAQAMFEQSPTTKLHHQSALDVQCPRCGATLHIVKKR